MLVKTLRSNESQKVFKYHARWSTWWMNVDLKKWRKRFKFMFGRNSIKNFGLVDEKSNEWKACNYWTILVEAGVEARDVRILTTQTYFLACLEIKQDDDIVVGWNPKGMYFWTRAYFEVKKQKRLYTWNKCLTWSSSWSPEQKCHKWTVFYV